MIKIKDRQFVRKVSIDKRDKKHRIKKGISSRKTRYWSDLKMFLDQEDTPHCVGFMGAHWLVNYPVAQYINPTALYQIAQFYDEYRGEMYEGSTVRGMANAFYKMEIISEYQWTWDVDTLVYAVLEIGPVMVGTNWYEGMSDLNSKGVMSVTGKLQGGHAWLINGVNVKTGLFRGKNSWGKSWGVGGRMWIHKDDMARLLKEDGECCIGKEYSMKL